MRFIGNKEPIVNEIKDLLKEEGLLNKKLKFRFLSILILN